MLNRLVRASTVSLACAVSVTLLALPGTSAGAAYAWSGVGAAKPDRGYAFLLTDLHGAPVRWNPCAAHTYRVNLNGMPRATLRLVHKAVGILAAGLGGETWRYAGNTTLVPRFDGESTRSRQGADIVIAFARPGKSASQSPDLGGSTAGVGGADTNVADLSAYAVGGVVIDSRPTVFGRLTTAERTNLLLHELGHAVGLAHTTRTTEVMFPLVSARTAWGPGDRAGLAKLGKQAGCFRRLATVTGLGFLADRLDPALVVARWNPVPGADGYRVTVTTATGSFTTEGGTSTSVRFAPAGTSVVTVTALSPHGHGYDSRPVSRSYPSGPAASGTSAAAGPVSAGPVAPPAAAAPAVPAAP